MDEDAAKVSPEDGQNNNDDEGAVPVPESPKPLAFTIEFDSPKAVDTQKHKNLLEKFQNRHRRGQSLSKLEETLPTGTTNTAAASKKHPHTGNLPRKSSFQSEGYFSSDEKCTNEKVKNVRAASLKLKSEMTLPLKHLTTDKMTQSFPNSRSFNLPSIESPEIELKDVSSPDELELISPISPNYNRSEEKRPLTNVMSNSSNSSNVGKNIKKVVRQYSSPECETEQFIDGTEFDFDKSDTVSDAGTYTLDADNYTEEQKARMSIDKDFKLEQVSFMKKAEEYIRSLTSVKETTKTRQQLQHHQQVLAKQKQIQNKLLPRKTVDVNVKLQLQQQHQQLMQQKLKEKREEQSQIQNQQQQQQQQQIIESDVNGTDEYKQKQKRLSLGRSSSPFETAVPAKQKDETTENVMTTTPAMLPPKHPVVAPLVTTANRRGVSNIDTALKQLSLSQNTTVTDEQPKQMNNGEGDLNDILNKTFTKIMFPSPKARIGGGGGMSGGEGGRDRELDQGCFTSVTSSGVFSRKPTAVKHARKSSLVHSEIHVEAYTDDGRQQNGEKNLQQEMEKVYIVKGNPKIQLVEDKIDSF